MIYYNTIINIKAKYQKLYYNFSPEQDKFPLYLPFNLSKESLDLLNKCFNNGISIEESVVFFTKKLINFINSFI